MKGWQLKLLLNTWPPLRFAGVRVLRVDPDFRYAKVRLALGLFNRNYVGTQFGGSLFSMTDPFWMIMALQCLGDDYVVWDSKAEIDFVAPGREAVFAEFRVDDAMLDEIRAAAANGEKYLRWCETEVKTAGGEVIARVRKQLYIRRKRGR